MNKNAASANGAIDTAILSTFRDAGAACESAEYGVANAVDTAGALIMDKLGLRAGSILEHDLWIKSRGSFHAGYMLSAGKRWKAENGGRTMPKDEQELASKAGEKMATRVRNYLIDAGVEIKQSESADAVKKRQQREAKAAERQAQDAQIVQQVRARADAEGTDEMLAAIEIAKGNPARMTKIMEALARTHAVENKAELAAQDAELKELRSQVRARVKDADAETLRAMLAC